MRGWRKASVRCTLRGMWRWEASVRCTLRGRGGRGERETYAARARRSDVLGAQAGRPARRFIGCASARGRDASQVYWASAGRPASPKISSPRPLRVTRFAVRHLWLSARFAVAQWQGLWLLLRWGHHTGVCGVGNGQDASRRPRLFCGAPRPAQAEALMLALRWVGVASSS